MPPHPHRYRWHEASSDATEVGVDAEESATFATLAIGILQAQLNVDPTIYTAMVALLESMPDPAMRAAGREAAVVFVELKAAEQERARKEVRPRTEPGSVLLPGVLMLMLSWWCVCARACACACVWSGRVGDLQLSTRASGQAEERQRAAKLLQAAAKHTRELEVERCQEIWQKKTGHWQAACHNDK